jgi:hypothetical protein
MMPFQGKMPVVIENQKVYDGNIADTLRSLFEMPPAMGVNYFTLH